MRKQLNPGGAGVLGKRMNLRPLILKERIEGDSPQHKGLDMRTSTKLEAHPFDAPTAHSSKEVGDPSTQEEGQSKENRIILGS